METGVLRSQTSDSSLVIQEDSKHLLCPSSSAVSLLQSSSPKRKRRRRHIFIEDEGDDNGGDDDSDTELNIPGKKPKLSASVYRVGEEVMVQCLEEEIIDGKERNSGKERIIKGRAKIINVLNGGNRFILKWIRDFSEMVLYMGQDKLSQLQFNVNDRCLIEPEFVDDRSSILSKCNLSSVTPIRFVYHTNEQTLSLLDASASMVVNAAPMIHATTTQPSSTDESRVCGFSFSSTLKFDEFQMLMKSSQWMDIWTTTTLGQQMLAFLSTILAPLVTISMVSSNSSADANGNRENTIPISTNHNSSTTITNMVIDTFLSTNMANIKFSDVDHQNGLPSACQLCNGRWNRKLNSLSMMKKPVYMTYELVSSKTIASSSVIIHSTCASRVYGCVQFVRNLYQYWKRISPFFIPDTLADKNLPQFCTIWMKQGMDEINKWLVLCDNNELRNEHLHSWIQSCEADTAFMP